MYDAYVSCQWTACSPEWQLTKQIILQLVKTSVQEELFVRGDMQETTDNVLLINSHFYKLRCCMTPGMT